MALVARGRVGEWRESQRSEIGPPCFHTRIGTVRPRKKGVAFRSKPSMCVVIAWGTAPHATLSRPDESVRGSPQ
jgi:hypothetical protein